MDGSKLTGHWRWSGGRGTEKKRLSQNYDDRNLANGHVCHCGPWALANLPVKCRHIILFPVNSFLE